MIGMEHEFVELRRFSKEVYGKFVLGGDVGATNTDLCIAGVKGNGVEPLFMLRFRSQELLGIVEAINETLRFADERYGIHVADACLSPAGPMNAERSYCKLTNVAWDIDVRKVLAGTLLGSVALVNDFEAVGFGIPFLGEKDLLELPHPGKHFPKPVPKSIKGIVGAGTGLGKAILLFDEKKGMYVPSPSEGGHEDFPVADSFEYELMLFAKDRRGGESLLNFEELLSGRGLVMIYYYLHEMEVFDRNDVFEEVLTADAASKPAIISKHSRRDPACKRTFELFVRFYARALRNFALNILARGGMYIAGGIAAKNISFFTSGELMKEFEINHTQHKLLRDIPVFVITNYNVSLFGAANVAANFPELAMKK
jgi:glucokinase